ncbi:MAG: DsbA family protein [Acidobacteriota bacterium]|jgi:protein-disulfide isomerase|nr:DsbA family protein [Acidobacteriota bacterium]
MLRKSHIAVLLFLCFTACAPSSVDSADSAAEPKGLLLNGSDKSPVKIEVFSDFQCAGCRQLFLNTIQPIIQNYKDKVCVIYYEYPLNIHPYARPAARYVGAASRLGSQKAKPVFESIFWHQEEWSKDGDLETTVAKALSREDFLKVKKMLEDPGILEAINDDISKELRSGQLRKVDVTPTMFITYPGRQQKVEGSQTYQVMQLLLDPLVK